MADSLISVHGAPAEIRGAVLALRAAPREVRNAINRNMRATMSPVWKGEVEGRLGSRFQRVMLGKGVRIQAGNPPMLIAANSSRAIGKARKVLTPSEQWGLAEFGRPALTREYTRKNRRAPGVHNVSRRVIPHSSSRGILPAKNDGYVLMPAVARIAPRLAAMFTQTVVRTYMDILNPR